MTPTARSVNLIPLFIAAGLPEPVAEYPFRGQTGKRRWRFDYAWPAQMVCFEREGGTWRGGRHTSGAGYAKDCEKYSEAAIAGWRVIRCTADQIQSGLAIELLLAAMRRTK